MMDIVERLRNRVHDAPMPSEHLLDEAADLIEEARDGLTAILDGRIPRPLGIIYRQDKAQSKHDLCVHHVPMYDDCGNCIDAHVSTILAKLTPSGKGE
jgi:hypothetical protein